MTDREVFESLVASLADADGNGHANPLVLQRIYGSSARAALGWFEWWLDEIADPAGGGLGGLGVHLARARAAGD